MPRRRGTYGGKGLRTGDLEEWKALGAYVGKKGDGGNAFRQFLEWVEAGGPLTRKGDLRTSIGRVRISKGEETKVEIAGMGEHIQA